MVGYNKRIDTGWIGSVLFRMHCALPGKIRGIFVRNLHLILGRNCELYSRTLRRIFCECYCVDIGMYTHGGCFDESSFKRRTVIGRYCSISTGVVANLNHPMNLASTSAIFTSPLFGISSTDYFRNEMLTIGNDVWIGQNVIILPSCSQIGDGAIIGAGAVVNKDIPPFAVVVGNPAKVVRYRFSEQERQRLLAEHWWEKDIESLVGDLRSFQTPLEDDEVR